MVRELMTEMTPVAIKPATPTPVEVVADAASATSDCGCSWSLTACSVVKTPGKEKDNILI